MGDFKEKKNPFWFSHTIVFYSERGTNNLRFAPTKPISEFITIFFDNPQNRLFKVCILSLQKGKINNFMIWIGSHCLIQCYDQFNRPAVIEPETEYGREKFRTMHC